MATTQYSDFRLAKTDAHQKAFNTGLHQAIEWSPETSTWDVKLRDEVVDQLQLVHVQLAGGARLADRGLKCPKCGVDGTMHAIQGNLRIRRCEACPKIWIDEETPIE